MYENPGSIYQFDLSINRLPDRPSDHSPYSGGNYDPYAHTCAQPNGYLSACSA